MPPEELFQGAQAAIERDDPEAAVQLLDRLLKVDPEHSQALLYRGQLARDSGDADAALNYFRRVPDNPPKDAGIARFLEGTILLERDQARAAEESFLRSTELHPAYPQPLERLVQLYVIKLNVPQLRRQLLALGQLRPWTDDQLVMFLSGMTLINKPEVNMPYLKRFLQVDPDDVDSVVATARYHFGAEEPDEAEAILSSALERHPRDSRLIGLLAEAYLTQSRPDEARALLAENPPASGASRWLWRSHGLYAFETGNWLAAAEFLGAIVRANPDDVAASYKYGVALDRNGQQAQAAAQLAQTQVRSHLNLRLSHYFEDRRRPALALTTAIELGNTLTRLNEHLLAAMWYQQALRFAPKHAEAQRLYEAAVAEVQVRGSGLLDPQSWARDFDTIAAKPSHQVLLTPPDTPAAVEEIPVTGIRLVDRHVEAGLEFQYFNGQSKSKYLLESLGGGVAVLDYDGDNRPDLYFTQGCRVPFDPNDTSHIDRLYRNRGDGTFEDVTGHAGLGDNGYGQGCAAADYDNDGDPDLCVARYGRNLFYRNNADGTFSEISDEIGMKGEQWTSSVAFGDLDLDGNSDLYVVNYLTEPLRICRTPDGRVATCSPGNFDGEFDTLYRNVRDGAFQDVTDSAGINVPEGKGLGIIVADLNADRWPDVYVANDGTPNFLFRNMGSEGHPFQFQEQGLASGAAVSEEGRPQAGMGIACADFNRDHRPDLHVTNFHNEVNTLYLNQSDMLFRDATRSGGLASPTRKMLGFGTQAVDFDLDGLTDIFVANGHIDDFRDDGQAWKMPPQLFRNRDGLRFDDVSQQSGEYFAGEYLGRGVARLDWNGDHRPDLVIVHQDQPAALMENVTDPAGRFLVLELRGVRSNRDATGAVITVSCGGAQFVHQVSSGDGFFASNSRRVIIGLGIATRIDELRVVWPEKTTQVWTDISVNSKHWLIQGRLEMIPMSD